MRQQESAALQYDTQFLQALSNVSKLPCCLWFGTSVWTSVQPHPCHTDGKWRETLEQGCAAEYPSIYFEDGIIFWGIFKLWKYYIAIGPAAYVSSDEEHRRSYAKKHSLPKDFTIQKASFGEMVQCLSLLTCHFWGSPTCDDQGKQMEYMAVSLLLLDTAKHWCVCSLLQKTTLAGQYHQECSHSFNFLK